MNNKKIKIINISHVADFKGGAEITMFELTAELQRSGYDVCVIVPKEGSISNSLRQAGIRYRVVPFSWAAYIPSETQQETHARIHDHVVRMPFYTELLRKESPSLIITNTTVIPWFAYAAQLLGIPHVWFLHELLGNKSLNIKPYPSSQKALELLSTIKSSYVCNSTFTREYYSPYLPNDSIAILEPKIDPAILTHFSYSPKPRSSSKDINLLCIGSIISNKNQLEVLQAIDILNKQDHQKYDITFLGFNNHDGYYTTLKQYINNHKLSSRVNFLDFTNDFFNTVKKYDYCINAAIDEAYGRVTIEAMALGLPVIASNSGGNTAILNGITPQYLYKLGSPDDLARKILLVVKEDSAELRSKLYEYAKHTITANTQKYSSYVHNLPSLIEKESTKHKANWITAEYATTYRDYTTLEGNVTYYAHSAKHIQHTLDSTRNELQQAQARLRLLTTMNVAEFIRYKLQHKSDSGK